MSVQFSLLTNRVTGGGVGGMRKSRDPLPLFSAGDPCEWFWHGWVCPLFDPLKVPWRMVLERLLWFEPCPCKFLPLDSCSIMSMSLHVKVQTLRVPCLPEILKSIGANLWCSPSRGLGWTGSAQSTELPPISLTSVPCSYMAWKDHMSIYPGALRTPPNPHLPKSWLPICLFKRNPATNYHPWFPDLFWLQASGHGHTGLF